MQWEMARKISLDEDWGLDFASLPDVRFELLAEQEE